MCKREFCEVYFSIILTKLLILAAVVGSDCQDDCWNYQRDFDRIFGQGSFEDHHHNETDSDNEY